MHLNSKVPTAAEGSRGVNTKWLRGETKKSSNLEVSNFLAKLKPPQPAPRTTTLGFALCINDAMC